MKLRGPLTQGSAHGRLEEFHHSRGSAMRMLIRFPILAIICAVACALASGQLARNPKDTVKTRIAQDSLQGHRDSTKTVTMTVDSTVAKQGSAARPADTRKPRSSTIRTVERQTAPHAAKNVPNVKNTKPTTK